MMEAQERALQAAVDAASSKLGLSIPFSWKDLPVNTCLSAARIACLSADELATLPEAFPSTVLNLRNEAAALSLLVSNMDDVCGGEKAEERQAALLKLCDSYADFDASSTATAGAPFPESSPEAELFRWVQGRGASSGLCPASFDGGLRGLMPADDNLETGCCAASVPTDLIITSTTAWQSDLGAVLSRIPGLTDDMAALIWTLVDSKDEESSWRPFWRCLPQEFGTGLSAPEDAVEVLEGTPAIGELLQARKHLQVQYESMQPVLVGLLRAYGSILKAEWLTWERFVWAAELWYAYAIQIEFPDGKQLSSLVPLVSLMNHTPTPHIVRFSLVDKDSDCLRLRPFRPCLRGQQCCLSYGPWPNSHLLVFYGFALRDNPFDVFPLSFEVPEGDPFEQQKQQVLECLSIPLDYNLRPPPALLPSRLLDCVRVVIADKQAMQAVGALGTSGGLKSGSDTSWQGGSIDTDNEEAAVSVLAATLEALLQPFAALAPPRSEHPFAAAAQAYVEGQAAILRHALDLCKPK